MINGKTDLRTAELFRACPENYLGQILDAAEEVQYETGQVLFEPGAESESVHVVVSGMVALYVMYHNRTMLTFDILGPNGVTGTSGFFPRDAHPVRAMAIMPSTLLVVPARFLQGFLLLTPTVSGPIYEALCHLMRRRIGNLIRVVTAEEATFPAEQPCPVHRDTRFLASANIRTGEIKGMCQREFACTVAQGKGCPMAGKPAQQFHTLFTPTRQSSQYSVNRSPQTAGRESRLRRT